MRLQAYIEVKDDLSIDSKESQVNEGCVRHVSIRDCGKYGLVVNIEGYVFSPENLKVAMHAIEDHHAKQYQDEKNKEAKQ